jgi:hypothetical protein
MAIYSIVKQPGVGMDRMGHDGGAADVLDRLGMCGSADVYMHA